MYPKNMNPKQNHTDRVVRKMAGGKQSGSFVLNKLVFHKD